MSSNHDNPDCVNLFESRGETSRFIYVKIDETGDFIFSCRDVGKEPRKLFDDQDYEFWVTINSNNKDKLLLALLESIYKGNFHVVDDFREFLKLREIPFEWMTWT